MKMMKKFGLLVALALIVTIGGVYATWNYSAQTGINSSHEHLNSNMADYVAGSNAYGTIIIFDNDMRLTIDDTNNDHVADLVVTGDMIFLFEPFGGDNVPDSVVADGLLLQYQVTQTANYIYDFGTANTADDKPIYNIIQATPTQIPITGNADHYVKITNENKDNVFGKDMSAHVGSFAIRITAAQAQACFELSQNFHLNTLEAYHDFETCLGKGNVGITVSAVESALPQS